MDLPVDVSSLMGSVPPTEESKTCLMGEWSWTRKVFGSIVVYCKEAFTPLISSNFV